MTVASDSPAEVAARLAAAEDTLRAIGAGEIDAFVIADPAGNRRVFTLSTADRPYRMFVENMRDGAATLSSDGLILYANARLAQMVSRSRESLLGSTLASLIASDGAIGWTEIHGPEGLGTTIELVLVGSDGHRTPVLVGSSPLEVDGIELTCVTFTDVSAQKDQDREIARLGDAQAERLRDLQVAQTALTRQATHDALTGLPNRELLVDRLNQALLQPWAMRRRSAAIFFIDLDGFKRVNDTLGHAVGNVVLQRVANRLSAILRPMDTVARFGGDEFVVLAPNLTSHLRAFDMGNRLVAELARYATDDDLGERVTASVGMSVSNASSTAEALLHEADLAMYRAKSMGGSRLGVFDDDLANEIEARALAQQTLDSALAGDRIVAYYQPVVDLRSGAIQGFEALARIADRDGSVLPPSTFMSVAEDTGLVTPLGRRMLEHACAEAARWNGPPVARGPLTVAVNVSSRQFEPGDLPSLVARTLEGTGLAPDLLHLELTETAIMDLRPDILRQLDEIRDLGVELGLDDFGTGYASLTHLRRLPLSFVKIDQSFVKGIGIDREDGRIVSAVVDLAANLGLRSVAEGVETREQLLELRKLGCDQAQGYLFARPVPGRDIVSALESAEVEAATASVPDVLPQCFEANQARLGA